MKKINRMMVTTTIMSFILFQCGNKNTSPTPVAPSITDFSPTSGAEGTAVTITGTNFSTNPSDNVVMFNNTRTIVASSSTTKLVVTVPKGATTGQISVAVGNVMTSSSSVFTVLPPPAEPLTFTSMEPSSGYIGNKITLKGTGFSTEFGKNIVKFNGVEAFPLTFTSNTITVTVPQGTTTGKITIAVGDQTVSSSQDFTVITVQPNSWAKLMDFPGVARERAVVFTTTNQAGTLCYVTTGFNMTNSALKDLWVYNPSTGQWTQKADFGGSARTNAVGFSIDGYGYVGLGSSSSSYNDFWQYDPAMNTWTQKANFGGTQTTKSVAFSTNGKGYVLGESNQLWEYSPSNDTWTRKADFTGQGTSRRGAVSFVIGTKAYVGLGSSFVSGILGSRSDFYEYDAVNNTWTQKADYPASSYTDFTVGFAIGSKGYVGTGGMDTYTKVFYEYDSATNIWTKKADVGLDARQGAFGFSANGKGYISSGYTTTYVKDFWVYTP